jgi:hypothetical protein
MDFWVLFKDLSPFAMAAIVLIVLGRGYFKSEEKKAEALVKSGEYALETAKANAASDERRDIERAKVAAQLILQQDRLAKELAEKSEKLAAELEISRRGTAVILHNIAERQATTAEFAVSSESRLTTQVAGVQDANAQSMGDLKDLFIMTFDMYMENPRATYERIKRMQKAWAEGDMDKAQAVVDEDVPKIDATRPAVSAAADTEGGELPLAS